MKYLLTLAQIFQGVENNVNVPKISTENRIQTILQIVFTTTGIIAVLIIAIAGLSYVISTGDPQRTARAKDAILYAIIGLAISVMAFTIVTFVIGRLF